MAFVYLVLLCHLALARSEETCSIDSAESACQTKYAQFDFQGWEFPLGLYSTQLDEVTDVEVAVKFGTVPDYLHGSLYRVGAGLYSLGGERRVNNIIDGLAKLHRWSFDKETGKIRVSSKFVRSSVYNRTMAAQEIPPIQHMGEIHPPLTAFEKLKILFYDDKNDNTNIAVWDLGTLGVTATTEQPLYIDNDKVTLDFIRKYIPPSDDKTIFETEFLSASHFNKHPTTGISINYKIHVAFDKGIFSGKTGPAYHFYEYHTNSDGDVVTKSLGHVTVAADDLRIVHSFGVSEHFIILPRFNMCFKWNSPIDIGSNIYWDARKPAVFDVLSLETKKVQTFKFTAYDGQHIINSFERHNSKGELEIVVDFPTRVYPVDFHEETVYDVLNVDRYKDPNWKISDQTIRVNARCRITRFILNTATGEGIEKDFPVMWNAPADSGIEFPTIHPDFRGRPYCFAYLQVSNKDFSGAAGIIKLDLCKEESIGWEEKNKFPVEPIFVPRPGSSDEDDGVVLSPVFDSVDNSTSLYIWSAKNLEVLAIVETPITVPFTLHGLWFDG